MSKTMCLLQMCLKPTNYRSLAYSKERIKQYVTGLGSFFKYIDILDSNQVDVYLTDNTIANDEELPQDILNCLPKNVRIITCVNNNYGCINKGAGLIEQWNYFKDIIQSYNWIIHFEPRQDLINFDLITNFLNNRRNLLTIDQTTKQFNTGLFCVKTITLINYINKTDLNNFVYNLRMSIEEHLFLYFAKNNIEYSVADKMGLRWHDVHSGTWISQ